MTHRGEKEKKSLFDKVANTISKASGGSRGKDRPKLPVGEEWPTGGDRLSVQYDPYAPATPIIDVSTMSEKEFSAHFSEMIVDMGLTEEKFATVAGEQRRLMVQQYLTNKGKQDKFNDSPIAYQRMLEHPSENSEKLAGKLSSLQVALRNQPVSWIREFGPTGFSHLIDVLATLATFINAGNVGEWELKAELEAVRCVQAFSNNNYGFRQLVESPNAILVLVQSLNVRNPAAMTETLKVLAASIVAEQSSEALLEALTIIGEREQRERFLSIVSSMFEDDEKLLIKDVRGEYAELAEAEQFILKLNSVKRMKQRLQAMCFKKRFAAAVDDMKHDITAVLNACEELRSSAKFKELLETVLAVGNLMNAGSNNAEAFAFEMTYLKMLNNTKSMDAEQRFYTSLWQSLLFLHHPPQLSTTELPSKRRASRPVAYAATRIGVRLRKIRFEQPGMEIDDALIESIAKIATESLQLTFIDAAFDGASLRRLADLTSLESLNFERCTVRRSPLGRLFASRLPTNADCEESLKLSLSSLTNLRHFASSETHFCRSLSVLTAIASSSVRAVSFNADSAGSVADSVDFLARQPALSFLELSGFSVQLTDEFWQTVPAGLEVLVLRNLRCTAANFVGLRTLSGLSIIDCSVDVDDASYQFADDDVIEICRQNPNLADFRLTGRSSALTTRAFTDGYARLHSLANFYVYSNWRIDAAAFADVCESNAATLRSIVVDDASALTLSALHNAVTVCRRLECVVVQADGAASDNFAPMAIRQFIDSMPPFASGCRVLIRVFNAPRTHYHRYLADIDFRCVAAADNPGNVSVTFLIGKASENRLGLLGMTSYVHSNKISQIARSAFDQLPQLQTLLLNGNALTTFESGVFSGASALERLNLRRNIISNLSSDAFDAVRQLSTLDLSLNQLDSLPTGIFAQLLVLSSIDLRGNRLSTLSKDQLPSTRVGRILLQGDPLQCDDNFKSFITYLAQNNVRTFLPAQPDAVCAGPSNVAGSKLRDMVIRSTNQSSLEIQPNQACCCEDGWVFFNGSCYIVGQDMLTWHQARSQCNNMTATLFVPNSCAEWDMIRRYAARAMLSWIGLTASEVDIVHPEWEAPSDLNVDESLPWWNERLGHGAAPGVTCAAYYAAPDPMYAYTSFYDCNIRNYYICERNSSLLSLLPLLPPMQKPTSGYSHGEQIALGLVVIVVVVAVVAVYKFLL